MNSDYVAPALRVVTVALEGPIMGLSNGTPIINYAPYYYEDEENDEEN